MKKVKNVTSLPHFRILCSLKTVSHDPCSSRTPLKMVCVSIQIYIEKLIWWDNRLMSNILSMVYTFVLSGAVAGRFWNFTAAFLFTLDREKKRNIYARIISNYRISPTKDVDTNWCICGELNRSLPAESQTKEISREKSGATCFCWSWVKRCSHMICVGESSLNWIASSLDHAGFSKTIRDGTPNYLFKMQYDVLPSVLILELWLHLKLKILIIYKFNSNFNWTILTLTYKSR